jgi:alanine racemase
MDRGYIYVNKKNYLDNIDYLNSLSDKELCLVVKANGYGHGVEWTVNTAIEAGVKWFATATINEAITVRKLSDSIRILLLTEPSLSEVEKAANYNIDLTVYNDFFVDGLEKSGLSINGHIKIDTGMHRVGCEPKDFEKIYNQVQNADNINLVGICTHFPVADIEKEPTDESIELFKEVISGVDTKDLLIHSDNSGSIFYNFDPIFNLSRIGLAVYGCNITPVDVEHKLKPTMEIKSRISNIQHRKKGEAVSYGKALELKRDTIVGTAPVGYADGYPWNSFPEGKVIINNQFCKLIGRVTMDQILFDITDVEAEVNDEVVILGSSANGKLNISVFDIAKWNKTIEWEVLTNINNRLERIEIE